MGIDARLRALLETQIQPTSSKELHEAIERVTPRGAPVQEESWGMNTRVEVLVRSVPRTTEPAFAKELRARGLTIDALAGTAGVLTATGSIALRDLSLLDSSPLVARIEAPRELMPEMLSSIASCRASFAHALNPASRGKGALLGIIDTGIDFSHQSFLNASGESRILAIWDQSAMPPPAGVASPVPYGRVFARTEIQQVLGGGPVISARDDFGHGTHVASIAGSAVAARHGVAPEADLLCVALASSGESLGRSKNAFDAFDWLIGEARRANLPIAINLSSGENGGGHTGSSPLELAMDLHCREPGVAIVKSAGNEQEWQVHSSLTLSKGVISTFEVVCTATKMRPGEMEIWADGADDLELSITPPTGAQTGWVHLGNAPQTFIIGGANRVRVEIDDDAEGTGDNLYTLFFNAGASAAGLLPGTWRVHVRPSSVNGTGVVHAWLGRTARKPSSEQLRFSPASTDPRMTLTTPGMARRVITVSSYVSRASVPPTSMVGSTSTFSSRGPTRYAYSKPDLAAPGEIIEAARSAHLMSGANLWMEMSGTSMAAPHVVGAAALLLAENPKLTGEQVRQILVRSAKPVLPANPDEIGAGHLDVEGAVALLRSGRVKFPEIISTTISGTKVTVVTDLDCTASLLYDAHDRRLAMGKRRGSIASLAAATTHIFDLTEAGSGSWFFEINVFSTPEGWKTIGEAKDELWRVTVA